MEPGSLPYWMAFAHARSFTNVRKMEFLIEAVFNAESDLRTVMDSAKSNAGSTFSFTEKEKSGWLDAIQEIPNYAFLAEELVNNNIRVISVMEPDYPVQLKRNLGKNAPILLYCKGNTDLLHKESIAIVGSRKCCQGALLFTESIAKSAVGKKQVVVSGFARGVDLQALDSALEYHGQSIIVLPQGILTYRSNIYYQHIIKGDVLVISPYHPKASWEAGLAMDRNKIIYGLATDIYVAESDIKGGTWEGVQDGLKKGRKIFVRIPDYGEKNANNILISNGAIGVEFSGLIVDIIREEKPANKPEIPKTGLLF